MTQDIHSAFKENPLAWGYYFLPHHFPMASPPFHLEILKTILNNKKTAICAARSHSKSTLCMTLFPIWGICFKRFRHIVILQANLEKAIASLKTIKTEFTDNEAIKKTYRITTPTDTQNLTTFRHPDGFETQIVCFGMEQMGKIRGSKFGAFRPDCVLVDDLETDELVRSRELREDLHRKFKDAVEPAVDVGADFRIVYIDTMKHYDSQLAKMTNPEMYTDFVKLHYKALNVNEKGEEYALWEERFPLKELKRLEKEDPIAFAKEYQGDPVTGQSATFNASDFLRWTINSDDYILYDVDGGILSRGSLCDCRVAIGYDLAWEEKRRHDFTAIVPVYITPNSEILVDYYVNEKGVKPDMLAEYVFNLNDKYTAITGKVVYHGFEKGKYEKVAKWLLDQEKKRRNKFPIFKDVPWGTDKKERITVPLQPRYANHAIFHRKDMGDLESQLLRFPSGTNDDLCFAKGTKIATPFCDKNIEDIKIGDLVITPFGNRRVLSCGITGKSSTIRRFGVTATPKHKIYTEENGFIELGTAGMFLTVNKLDMMGILKWRYRRLLSSMESDTVEWAGRESIISLSQIQIQGESVPKDFMLRFMSFIAEKKLKRATTFIIKMATLLITSLITLSVYRLTSTIGNQKEWILTRLKLISKGLDHLLQSGINLVKVLSGTDNTHSTKYLKKSAISAEKITLGVLHCQNTAPKNVHQRQPIEEVVKESQEFVWNMSVAEDGVYYANGVLVSNCDAMTIAVRLLEAPTVRTVAPKTEDDRFNDLRAIFDNKKAFKGYTGQKYAGRSIPATKSFIVK